MTSTGNGLHRVASSSGGDDEGAHIGDAFCQECYGLGRFKIEKRDVPAFREIIVRAFECEDCGRTSEEVELAGQYGAEGVRLTLQVPQGCAANLGRKVLKSDTATVSVPELEFEIGAGAYVPFTGDLTTVADVLMQACKNLNLNQASEETHRMRALLRPASAVQAERRAADADTAGKIDAFIEELEAYAAGQHAFTFVVEDHAGNSFISGPDGDLTSASEGDPQLRVERYRRTAAQESRMGLAMPHEFLEEGGQGGEEQQGGVTTSEPASAPGRLILRVEGGEEVRSLLAAYAAQQHAADAARPAGVQLPNSCARCGTGTGLEAAVHAPVPAFIHDCLIISTLCGSCGAASAEVRGTGGVSERGARLRLRVECPADLERTVLQSASASVAVPELELALSSGGGSGMATTVGSLINNLAQQLGSNPALAPRGATAAAEAGDEQAEFRVFVDDLRACAALERPWTLELTDPLNSSFVSAPVGEQATADTRLSVEPYERTAEENQHFGLATRGNAAPIA